MAVILEFQLEILNYCSLPGIFKKLINLLIVVKYDYFYYDWVHVALLNHSQQILRVIPCLQ